MIGAFCGWSYVDLLGVTMTTMLAVIYWRQLCCMCTWLGRYRVPVTFAIVVAAVLVLTADPAFAYSPELTCEERREIGYPCWLLILFGCSCSS